MIYVKMISGHVWKNAVEVFLRERHWFTNKHLVSWLKFKGISANCEVFHRLTIQKKTFCYDLLKFGVTPHPLKKLLQCSRDNSLNQTHLWNWYPADIFTHLCRGSQRWFKPDKLTLTEMGQKYWIANHQH